MYRIAIGEIAHETNTFCPPTTLSMFQHGEWCVGDAILARYAGTRTYLGGMIDAAAPLAVELGPTFAASAEPWGTITRDAYEAMVRGLVEGLRAAMPLDAVCLSLHGAGVAEGIDDLETAVLEAVREVVGTGTPVAATLDLHGNITARTAELATGLFGVHEYPHVDAYERGQEAMAFLVRVLRGEIRPAMVIETLPLLIPASPSRLEPASLVNEVCHRWKRQAGMIDCAFMHGFSQTDIPQMGVSVIALADRDRALAQRAARDVAREIWERREAFQKKFPAPSEAVAEAARLAQHGGPVVINEISDNPGGGAPGDGTHLLRAMLDGALEQSAFGTLYDPAAAEAAHRAGVGATLHVALGAHFDRMHGDPLEVDAYVKALTDGRFRRTTPMGRGQAVDLGKMARLVVRGVDIVVASVRTQVLDPQPFALQGIDVAECRVVGLKSSAHFRAGFDGVARHIVSTDPPGLSTSTLANFPYQRVRRPIYPIDRAAKYTPETR